MRTAIAAALLVVSAATAGKSLSRTSTNETGFLLAGERIRFDAKARPEFTEDQIKYSAEATRSGLVKWAATPSGRRMILRFDSAEYAVTIREDWDSTGAGSAPQPALATLVAATDHAKTKAYDLILNPTFMLPKGVIPVSSGEPATPADMMAAAWAAEMLHIDFYARGISLPHHSRPDFQSEWRVMAAELGFPNLPHDDESERPPRQWRTVRARR
ncbi:MAG TPA: hypothetical protein VNU27_07835 [Candidatus Acidoferrum sp.]|jgi:hypothetical protein|nr:hypothetical protein [Candidatus Acidoferrum sp.]